MPFSNPLASAEVESALGPPPVSHTRPELVVVRFRRHGRHLILPVIVLLAVAAATGFWLGTFPEEWMNLLAGVGAILIAVLLGVLPVLAWLTQRTTVTTRRVITRSGFFVRHRSEVAFSRVREVRTRRGIIQRMRGAGDIDLLHGTDTLVLSDVADVVVITEALQELMERNYEHFTRGFSAPGFSTSPQMPLA